MFCEKLRTLSEENSGFTMNSFLGKLDCYALPLEQLGNGVLQKEITILGLY